MNTAQQHIIRILVYFDIFHYPLTNEEIRSFLPQEAGQEAMNIQLAELVKEKMVFRLGEFYSLRNDIQLAERRRKGNAKAMEEMKNAASAARILSRFPYVEGLAISGSLSKNFADENTDVDFFIITKANRLWIARTIMHLFYKITLLTGRHRWFCMNYYVDEAGLEIKEKNIYTAMEIVTLIPMQGTGILENFMDNNSWTRSYFPLRTPSLAAGKEIKKNIIRSLIEKLFSGKRGDAVDNWLMNLTNKRWLKKVARHEVNNKGVGMSMIVGKHFAKPDPSLFQNKVVEQYETKLQQLVSRYSKSPLMVM